jgi:hypothetical protein
MNDRMNARNVQRGGHDGDGASEIENVNANENESVDSYHDFDADCFVDYDHDCAGETNE